MASALGRLARELGPFQLERFASDEEEAAGLEGEAEPDGRGASPLREHGSGYGPRVHAELRAARGASTPDAAAIPGGATKRCDVNRRDVDGSSLFGVPGGAVAERPESREVRVAQERLNFLAGVRRLPEDGQLDPRTSSALRAFQARAELRETGLADEVTSRGLAEATLSAVIRRSSAPVDEPEEDHEERHEHEFDGVDELEADDERQPEEDEQDVEDARDLTELQLPTDPPTVSRKDLMRRWRMRTGVAQYPQLHQLVDHWRHELGADYLPLALLIAFSARETARGYRDHTAGVKNGDGVYEPAFYELGVFQVPAGEHGRGTAKTYPPPGKKNTNPWFRFCGELGICDADWQDPTTQVQIGIANLHDESKKMRKRFPKLFGDPGSDWALRAAVLMPFGPGGGYTARLLAKHQAKLLRLPETSRWAYLQSKRARTRNVDEKMTLFATLTSLLAATSGGAAPAPTRHDEADELDEYEDFEPLERFDEDEEGDTAHATELESVEELDEVDELGTLADELEDDEVVFEGLVAAATVATNLAAISVSVRTETLHDAPNAFALNAIASANTEAKRRAFLPAQKAFARLVRLEAEAIGHPALNQEVALARAAVRTASETLRPFLASHGVAHNRTLRSLRASLKGLRKTLAHARRGRHPNAPRVAELEANVTTSLAAIQAVETKLRSDIAAFQPQVTFDRSHFTVDVGGVKVRLHDHEITYATDTPLGMEGKADGDGRAGVDAAIARSGLSADKQAVLKIVSRHEGTFTTMNTWDRAVVTTGFLQWITGEGGDGSLIPLLQSVLDAHPTVFRDRLGAYGIELDRGKLVVTLADGTVLRGGPAARHVQTNPKLAAVISAASMAPEVQVLQMLAAARDKIDNVRASRVVAKGQAVRVGDVVTSTYAVGILTDVAVHGGEGRARERVTEGLKRFLAHEPSADLTDGVTRTRAAPFVVTALTIDPSRARDFDPLNHDAGSFVP